MRFILRCICNRTRATKVRNYVRHRFEAALVAMSNNDQLGDSRLFGISNQLRPGSGRDPSVDPGVDEGADQDETDPKCAHCLPILEMSQIHTNERLQISSLRPGRSRSVAAEAFIQCRTL